MERSTIQVLAKRGKSQRQIAKELGRSRTTVARALQEPVDRRPARHQRASQVDPYRPQIEHWLNDGLSIVRMLELARADPQFPYRGGRSVFNDMVRRIRSDLERTRSDVPLRFEGLPAEYLQVDWGEIRRFPFTQQPATTRYFLACRLKYSRWSWVCFTTDMRQETLLRGLVDCCVALGWVPWVMVFDNMKTVTSGRDSRNQPIWTPALLHLAAELGFHPQACDPAAPNQKGSVESLVKWVKGNFLPGRTFTDDTDLATEAAAWTTYANSRPSSATGEPPLTRLPLEAAKGGSLPLTAYDYGLREHGQVSSEALVAVNGNRYSVPVAYVGLSVTVRVHRQRIRIWRDTLCIADHLRAADGARQRVIDVAHFASVFARKPRAQVMMYREALLEQGGAAPAFLSELSRRCRAQLGPEIRRLYLLYEQYGPVAWGQGVAAAERAGLYSADAVTTYLGENSHQPPVQTLPLVLLGVPPQEEVDRLLSLYEAWVQIDEAQGHEEVAV